MSTTQLIQSQLEDRFGRQVAARLAAGTAEIPYNVTERLRAARVQAVARRKQTQLRTASSVISSGGAAALTFGDGGQSLWNRIASALPLIALAAGLILIHTIENDRRASEVAEVDAALLTDDLPPSAYADPGFVQFLKSGD
ncbi:DUF3619 family protein [Caenimonas soli]|uniref:DUF3619 family protein n=1 Tax=Caenimonas soli TaxID=2735555 RepID=UPI00155289F3|nr:DUF3619 family protein [Caenimonas soli]NPC54373.1 DUF3619 family protein [Caenimonas soli]